MSQPISSSSDEESSQTVQEQNRILKNSNIFKQKSTSHINCFKHPSKKAKYYAEHDKRTLFCSKCALNLALKGHKIEESSGSELEVQRQIRINNFQELLKQSLQSCNMKIIDLNALQINSKQLLDEQKLFCSKFFDQVIETAYQLKQTYIEKFLLDHQGFEQKILDCQQAVTNCEKQLHQFQIDIDKNHSNIVKKMEMKPFDEIMSRYEKKVQCIKQLLIEMKLEHSIKPIQLDQQQILTFMNKMCYNLLLNDTTQNIKSRSNSLNYNNPSLDMKVFDILENDDIYQSTFSNTIKDSNSQNPPSPVSKLPIYKSDGSNPISTIQNSRRESNLNTPESWNQTNIQVQEQQQQHQPQPYNHNNSLNDQQILQQVKSENEIKPNIVKIVNENNLNNQEQQKMLEISPLIQQKSIGPQSIKFYNSNSRNQLEQNINKSQDAKQRKKQPSVDEQKRFYINNQSKQEDTLKDRIFKELSGHSSESVYTQVLKLNNNQSKVKRGKENSQLEWTGSLRMKQNLLVKK